MSDSDGGEYASQVISEARDMTADQPRLMQGNVWKMLREGRLRLRGREGLSNVGKQFVGVLRIRQQTPLLSLI